MKNKLYKILPAINIVSIITIILVLSSCNKDNTSNSYIAKAVVQAYLVSDQPISVYIKKEILIGATDTTTQTIDNLIVKISSSGSTILLAPKGKGIYSSDSTFKAITGQTYTLDFNYNGKEITASTVVPSKPTGVSISASSLSIPANSHDFSSSLGSLVLNWNNPDNDYFLVLVQSLDTLTPIDTSFSRKRFFRDQPVQSNNARIDARNFSYYGQHDVILYKLNADYAALYNGSQNNSQNLTKPISNINNGLGIFSGMNSDTLLISITQ